MMRMMIMFIFHIQLVHFFNILLVDYFSLMSDQVLESGVSAVVTRCESRGQLYDEQAEILIDDIHSVTIKVKYLVCLRY